MYDPMSQMERRMNMIVRDMFNDLGMGGNGGGSHAMSQQQVAGGRMWWPRADFHEDADSYQVQIELPGLKKEDVHVDVDDKVGIRVWGEMKEKKEMKGNKGQQQQQQHDWMFCERRYGRFERVFPLAKSVKAEEAHAKFDSGVLELTVPKAPESRAKTITIQ